MIICSGHGRKPYDEFIPSFNVHLIKPSKLWSVISPRRTANSWDRAKNKHSFGEGMMKTSYTGDKTKGIKDGFCRVEKVKEMICVQNPQWLFIYESKSLLPLLVSLWKLHGCCHRRDTFSHLFKFVFKRGFWGGRVFHTLSHMTTQGLWVNVKQAELDCLSFKCWNVTSGSISQLQW